MHVHEVETPNSDIDQSEFFFQKRGPIVNCMRQTTNNMSPSTNGGSEVRRSAGRVVCGTQDTGDKQRARLVVHQPRVLLRVDNDTFAGLTTSVCQRYIPTPCSEHNPNQARVQREQRNAMRAVHRLAHRVSCVPAVALLLLASSNFQAARGSIELPRRTTVTAPPRPAGTSDSSGHNNSNGDDSVVGSDGCSGGRADVGGLDGAGMPSTPTMSGSYAARGGGGGGVGVARRAATQVCLLVRVY